MTANDTLGDDRRPAPRVADGIAFFALTFVLTLPFWAASALIGWRLLPGLPLAAIAVVCPAASALALSARRGGVAAARLLLARAWDAGRIQTKIWWLPILMLSPLVSVATFLILRLGGAGVPDPRIAILPALALAVLFVVSALCEEIGWTGFALARLQERLGWLGAALLIGAVWALWHIPALLQAQRSATWIAWWALGTVAMRVIMVWVFNRSGGSVFGVSVLHAGSNLCWQLFPVHGSWFDPRLNGLLLAGVAGVIVVAEFRRRGCVGT